MDKKAALKAVGARIRKLREAKGISAFHQRSGQNDAGASDATTAVADGRFRVGLRPGTKVGFFNSPTATAFL